MNKKEMQQQKEQEYDALVKEITPKNNLFLQMIKAFLVGGVICCIGQGILEYCASLGLDDT